MIELLEQFADGKEEVNAAPYTRQPSSGSSTLLMTGDLKIWTFSGKSRTEYGDLLMEGCFLGEKGFRLESASPYVLANAFVSASGKEMGVLVWNVAAEAADFTLAPEEGWKLSKTAAPGEEPVEGPLPARSLRLLVFQRAN